jgi:hypothetical protein
MTLFWKKDSVSCWGACGVSLLMLGVLQQMQGMGNGSTPVESFGIWAKIAFGFVGRVF